MSKPDFKFTLDDLNNMMVEALEEQPGQAQPEQKPNILQLLRGRKENKEPEWPLV